MKNKVEYLKEARDYFNNFMDANFSDYFETMRKSRVGRRTGYSNFHRDSEVIQHIRDIVHNLEETFGNVEIPQKFTSPNSLIETWNRFYNFLLIKNELFNDIKKVSGINRQPLPEPFYWIYKIHNDVIGLLEKILSMDEVKKEGKPLENLSIQSDSDKNKFDIVVLTALYDTEFEAVLNVFKPNTIFSEYNDATTYYTCLVGKKEVLLATDYTMGLTAASALTTKIISKFSPKVIIMSGILAGIKDKNRNYGDILVASHSYNYESGKYKFNSKTNLTEFEPNPEQISLSKEIVKIINKKKSDNRLLNQIKTNFIQTKVNLKPKQNLAIELGVIASGSAVLADNKKVAEIKKFNRKLIGIDMETFAVMYAAQNYSSRNDILAVSIKSISDFADQRKNDKFRNYAAYTSASFIYDLILKELQ